MYNNLRIVRTAPDGLSEQVWGFCLIDLIIVLDNYVVTFRATKRHKFVLDKARVYSRLSPRNSTLTVDAVPLPDDVQAEARQRIVDQVQVVREHHPFEIAVKVAISGIK